MSYFYRNRHPERGYSPQVGQKSLVVTYFRRFLEAISPKKAMLDIMLSTLRNEPTDKMLPNEPMEPIEKAEPLDPIDINELVDHKLKTEFLEPMLLIEFSFSMTSA